MTMTWIEIRSTDPRWTDWIPLSNVAVCRNDECGRIDFAELYWDGYCIVCSNK